MIINVVLHECDLIEIRRLLRLLGMVMGLGIGLLVYACWQIVRVWLIRS